MRGMIRMGVVSGVLLMGGWAFQAATGLRSAPAGVSGPGRCDARSIADVFASDPDTRVTVVKAFAKGDELSLDGKPGPKKAERDMCLVKLMVGPGSPGPVDAPSTQAGIGIEIWLPSPAQWNRRIHVVGGGGFSGMSDISSRTQISGFAVPARAYDVAGAEGAVSAVTDTGHAVSSDPTVAASNGSFLMNPDGTINKTQWRDFAGRSLHELATKTKQLTAAYYGSPADYAYFDGCSGGGRQALRLAQDYPEDFNGILAGDPTIYWTTFRGAAELYPQLVFGIYLGGQLISPALLDLVSAAAVSACDTDLNGKHLGYITDPGKCRYNPLDDPKILCKAEGGASKTGLCVTRKQAAAINKIWYGQTIDGSAPDPMTANGYGGALHAKQVWFGLPRGTQLWMPAPGWGLAGSENGERRPFPVATHQLALNLQKSSLAMPNFVNATGNGADGWKHVSYAELARSAQQGMSLQASFAHINTDKADLSAFKARKGKLILYHGMADQTVPVQGSIRYYESVAAKMGGYNAVRSFFRFYPVPAMGHCFGVGSVNGLPGVSPKSDPPLPVPNQLYQELVAWVEEKRPPDTILLRSASGATSHPLCEYPAKLHKSVDRSGKERVTCR